MKKNLVRTVPRPIRNGFTLVELMVVVAIIGILSSVAVPSFKKYQIKSRTTEAKMLLADLHTAMQAGYADWGTYVNCLWQIGVDSRKPATYGYYTLSVNCNIGWGSWGEACFPSNSWGNPFVRANFIDECLADGTHSQTYYLPNIWKASPGCELSIKNGGNWSGMDTVSWAPVVNLTQSTFIAWAGAYIGSCAVGATADDQLAYGQDAWTLDNNKQFLHIKEAQ